MSTTLTFVNGPISHALIGESIASFSQQTQIGAHSIFLGQVRKDVLDDKDVLAIDYSTYTEMAQEVAAKISEDCRGKFELQGLEIVHSLGAVKAGEICLFVIAASKHRKNAIEGCAEIVERIKQDLPVWGKEILQDDSHQWKVNR